MGTSSPRIIVALSAVQSRMGGKEELMSRRAQEAFYSTFFQTNNSPIDSDMLMISMRTKIGLPSTFADVTTAPATAQTESFGSGRQNVVSCNQLP